LQPEPICVETIGHFLHQGLKNQAVMPNVEN
jgi:hypothetical protein